MWYSICTRREDCSKNELGTRLIVLHMFSFAPIGVTCTEWVFLLFTVPIHGRGRLLLSPCSVVLGISIRNHLRAVVDQTFSIFSVSRLALVAAATHIHA